MKWKQAIISLLVILASAGLTLVMVLKPREILPVESPELIPSVQCVLAQAGMQRSLLTSQGHLRSKNEITLSSQVDGVIVEMAETFAAGSVFEEGDVLLRIEKNHYEHAVAQAQGQLAAAELKLAQVEAEGEVAVRDWEVLKDMVELTPSPLMLKEPQMKEARQSLASAKASLRSAEFDLEKTVIRAPFTGKLLKKMMGTGQFVRRGEPLATMYESERFEVFLPITMRELGFLSLPAGKTAGKLSSAVEVDLFAEAGGQRWQWTALAKRLSASVEANTGVIFLIAELPRNMRQDPGNDEEILEPLPGMYVEAEIHGKSWAESIVVPRSALGPEKKVGVIGSNDQVHLRDVEVGQLLGDQVILIGGIEDGERVVAMFREIPFDGAKVLPMMLESSVGP